MFLSGSFLFVFTALNEIEEVAQEDGVALVESHSEAIATNQALLPMEIDEEQAGNFHVNILIYFFHWLYANQFIAVKVHQDTITIRINDTV